MYYTVFPTKAGWLALAGDEKGLAVLTLPARTREEAEKSLNSEGDRVFPKLIKPGEAWLGRLEWTDDYFGPLKDELTRYFLGEKVVFTAAVNWDIFTPFQRDVLKLVYAIPYGEVQTYGRLARAIGKPGAARAVGGALRRNSIPLVIPCHRVVQSDGSLGGFSGIRDNDQKRFLLRLEGWLRPAKGKGGN